jgi:Putative DNA-binding domain
VLLVTDVSQNELEDPARWSRYQRDLHFFDATLSGESPRDLHYIRDDRSNHKYSSWIVTEDPGGPSSYFLQPTFEGIDRIEAVGAVELMTTGALIRASSTARVLADDYYVGDPYRVPFGSLVEYGAGYGALIAADVSQDIVVDHSPDNALWIGKLLTYLSDAAKRNQSVLADPISLGRPDAVSGTMPAARAPKLVPDLIHGGESATIEFKSSAWCSSNPDVPEKAITTGIVKTVAAFSNSSGGTLLIGVADDGQVLGLEPDYQLKNFNRDGYENALVTLISTAIDKVTGSRCRFHFETIDAEDVCVVEVEPSPNPVYADTDKGKGVFFVRSANTTQQLETKDVVVYIKARWGNL